MPDQVVLVSRQLTGNLGAFLLPNRVGVQNAALVGSADAEAAFLPGMQPRVAALDEVTPRNFKLHHTKAESELCQR